MVLAVVEWHRVRTALQLVPDDDGGMQKQGFPPVPAHPSKTNTQSVSDGTHSQSHSPLQLKGGVVVVATAHCVWAVTHELVGSARGSGHGHSVLHPLVTCCQANPPCPLGTTTQSQPAEQPDGAGVVVVVLQSHVVVVVVVPLQSG